MAGERARKGGKCRNYAKEKDRRKRNGKERKTKRGRMGKR